MLRVLAIIISCLAVVWAENVKDSTSSSNEKEESKQAPLDPKVLKSALFEASTRRAFSLSKAQWKSLNRVYIHSVKTNPKAQNELYKAHHNDLNYADVDVEFKLASLDKDWGTRECKGTIRRTETAARYSLTEQYKFVDPDSEGSDHYPFECNGELPPPERYNFKPTSRALELSFKRSPDGKLTLKRSTAAKPTRKQSAVVKLTPNRTIDVKLTPKKPAAVKIAAKKSNFRRQH